MKAFLENQFLVLRIDPDPRVPDLNQPVAATFANADQNPAFGRIFKGVVDQIAQHAHQQTTIGIEIHLLERIKKLETQTILPCQRRELGIDGGKQIFDRNRLHIRLQKPGIKLGNIQQGIQQLPKRINRHRQKPQNSLLFFAKVGSIQSIAEQTDGLNRLPQIMARRRQESRFAAIGPLGLLFGHQQFFFGRLEQRNIGLGNDISDDLAIAIPFGLHLADHMELQAIRPDNAVLADKTALRRTAATSCRQNSPTIVRMHELPPARSHQLFAVAPGQRHVSVIEESASAAPVQMTNANRNQLRQLTEHHPTLFEIGQNPRFTNTHPPQTIQQKPDERQQQHH